MTKSLIRARNIVPGTRIDHPDTAVRLMGEYIIKAHEALQRGDAKDAATFVRLAAMFEADVLDKSKYGDALITAITAPL